MAVLPPGETASWMAVKRAIRSVMPLRVLHKVRNLPYVAEALFERQGADDLTPPRHLMFEGVRDRSEFVKNGESALNFYRDIGKISPYSTMLDIGCGIGRKTVPLLNYLDNKAMYIGVDINPDGISWCLRHITKKNPRFMFFSIDLHNKFYAPNGIINPSELVLPFADASFDVVTVWSVFTHMYPKDIEHYISEISRVIKPNGLLIVSFFLMNDASIERLERGESALKFIHHDELYWTTNPNIPEDAIAVRDDWIQSLILQYGIAIESVRYGAWAGNEVDPQIAHVNYQDIIMGRKPSASTGTASHPF